MKSLAVGLMCLGAGWVHGSDVPWPKDPEGQKMFVEAQKRIAAWHADTRGAVTNVIRVVYFHGSDQEPLPDWEERSQRILADASAFYRDGFARFGGAQAGLPFERKDDRYVIHRVTGKKPAKEYTHQSGNETYREMGEALRGTFDVHKEHVLALHGLCRKEKEGKFVFHAPYYGRGSHRNGICHAADCEVLDPENLSKTDQKIVYAEHYYARKEQKLSLFNTWYLGGIAHELGHGLGLPHDAGRPWEQGWSRASLMGMGNHHYRSDRWGGKTPSFLSLASAL